MADRLESIAIEAQVPHVRDGLDVRLTVGRHDPRAEYFHRRIGYHQLRSSIPWHEGGDAPNPGEKGWDSWEHARAKVFTPVVDDPPWEVYCEYENRWYE